MPVGVTSKTPNYFFKNTGVLKYFGQNKFFNNFCSTGGPSQPCYYIGEVKVSKQIQAEVDYEIQKRNVGRCNSGL